MAQKSLNVVIVGSELPYPPTAGNRIRTLNLALRLGQRHRVTFLAYRNSEADEAVRFLGEHGIGTELVDRAIPQKAGAGFYLRLLANLASPRPYSVESHDSKELRELIRARALRGNVDLWQIESITLLSALESIAGTPKLLIAHNVESLIWRRYFEAELNPAKRWYIKQQWHKFERFERDVFSQVTRVVAVSDQDSQLIREHFGCNQVSVVDNGIDRGYYEPVAPERDPNQILFLGSLDWRPNLDAIGLLLDQIFPAVKAAEPSARLVIVGRRPPQRLVRRVAGMDGLEIHADVPDVRPFLAQSGVMAVPLRIGGGSRLKILEALACGLPVVSTHVGAEGLELEPGQHYIAADEPETMARQLVACIRNPHPPRQMAERCRALVLDRYSWDALAYELERIWFACLEGQ
jgi:glycosyltransferase involved in cell wall biosynthesis